MTPFWIEFVLTVLCVVKCNIFWTDCNWERKKRINWLQSDREINWLQSRIGVTVWSAFLCDVFISLSVWKEKKIVQ